MIHEINYENQLYNQAIKDFNIGIGSGLFGNELYLYRGNSYFHIEEYENGLKDINTYLSRSPNNRDNVYKAYESRDPKEGKAKLALLNFWYDALKYHDKDPEFWTDMLYFGLKIISKGQFGPHVKIS